MAKAAEPALFEDGEIADAPDAICQSAYEAYNAVAKKCSWRVALVLTESRRKTLRRAVKDYGGIAGFRAAMERASKSPFLLGKVGRSETHRNWKPDLDFFCQPKSIVRLIEGGYDGEEEAPKRIRMPNVWRPPTANAKPFVQTETLEQRLAASIVSYRKVGNYKRANEIEQKLADMEKRPAVLVPAPDAVNPDVVPIKGAVTERKTASYGKPGETPVKSRQGPIYDVDDEYDRMEPE